ncbi:uncharacterized protein HaLaN_16979, partial [Haematococcus lacustris]
MLAPTVWAMALWLWLGASESDGALVCGLAEAYAKGLEHKLLLTLLLPPEPLAEGEGDPAAKALSREFKYRQTLGYELLPSARVKAAGMSPAGHVGAAAIISAEFPRAVAICEAALGKAGNAQSQSLFESYARLQQLRGQAVSIPAGTAATSEQTSRVVGVIEAVSRGSGGETELRQAMSILKGLPLVNVELWAKLARAAAQAKAWAVALECCQAAAAVMPTGFELSSVETPAEIPEINANGWFWLAVSEAVHGQATLALVRPDAQDDLCQLSLRKVALDSFVVAARFAGFVKKADMVEHVVRMAWTAAQPFMRKPLLRVAIVSPLRSLVRTLNQHSAMDRHFQVMINVVLLEALASGRMWAEALSAVDDAIRSIPSRSLHRPLWTWKSYCLAQSGRNVLSEMGRTKEYTPECQSHAWVVLSHHSAARYDQLLSLQRSLQAVAQQQWNKADYLMEYAEWLISSGQNDGETAEDVLLSAADALLEFDVGE